MKYIVIIFLLVLSHISYTQGGDKSHGRSKVLKDALVSVFVPIEVKQLSARWSDRKKLSGYETVIGFQLKYYDTGSRLIWQTKCSILDYDSSRYLVKTDIPESIRSNTHRILCVAFLQDSSAPQKITSVQYGGVSLSSIKLHIASNPEGAETFLIPNRIWNKSFAGKKWQDIASQLNDYRVNPTFTSTHVFIDETVYAVVCKKGSKFSMIRHNTMPMNVSKEQNVIVPFE